jgi:hypothetical protein
MLIECSIAIRNFVGAAELAYGQFGTPCKDDLNRVSAQSLNGEIGAARLTLAPWCSARVRASELGKLSQLAL